MSSTPRNVSGLVPLTSDPASGTAGDHYWNSTLQCERMYDGTTWHSITSAAGTAPPIEIAANTVYSPGVGQTVVRQPIRCDTGGSIRGVSGGCLSGIGGR